MYWLMFWIVGSVVALLGLISESLNGLEADYEKRKAWVILFIGSLWFVFVLLFYSN